MPIHHSSSDDEQWAPVSDLMAVIMLIFMLIAMVLFAEVQLDKQSNESQCDINRNMLGNAFRNEFEEWGAILDKDLTIRFAKQTIFSGVGQSDVKGKFAERLKVFFPRYMEIVRKIQNSPQDEILEIRIEGHTSSEFKGVKPEDTFIENMELSQDRARNILKYVLDSAEGFPVADYEEMVKNLVTANGLSSSRLLYRNGNNGACEEDKDASRRVEFKLLTKACQKSGVYDRIDKAESRCS